MTSELSKITDIHDVGADFLVEAILERAIKDYEFALKWKDIEPKNRSQEESKREAKRLYKECEIFFRSHWYSMMCKMNGDDLMKKIREHYCEYDCSILTDMDYKKKHKRKKPIKIEFE